MATPTYSIFELVDRLGLDYTTRGNLNCPFCADPDRRKTLHLNDEKDYWRCNKCKSGGGVLHFYSKYVLGYDLPSSSEGKSSVAKQLREFMGHSTETTVQRKSHPKKAPKVPVASDDRLNEVYSAMANLPALQLTAAHRKDLKRRGLPEDVIERNQYRSIPEKPSVPDTYTEMYETEGGENLRATIFSWNYSPHNIQFGLMIAHQLTSAGFDLNGVPGFFKFGRKWCLWYTPGILIPTRNLKGQIVIWQVRQKRAPKYLTLSCSSLPGSVTEQVSRCHVPLGNTALSPDVPVIYTEGPLKGDIACHLYGKPVVFLAIPGINTTKDLLRILTHIKNVGITEVENGLDMDRLTNPNVRKGSRELATEIRKLGLSVREIYWGIHYARSKYMALATIAKLRNVSVPPCGSNTVFDLLGAVAEALDNAGIKPCHVTDESGKTVSYYWEAETKGIDDFLLHNTELETE